MLLKVPLMFGLVGAVGTLELGLLPALVAVMVPEAPVVFVLFPTFQAVVYFWG